MGSIAITQEGHFLVDEILGNTLPHGHNNSTSITTDPLPFFMEHLVDNPVVRVDSGVCVLHQHFSRSRCGDGLVRDQLESSF